MNKDLNYYMGLGYIIEIIPIPESDGGGFMARLPQFGELGIVADGETMAEALENLEKYKKETFERFIAEGKKIPELEQNVNERLNIAI